MKKYPYVNSSDRQVSGAFQKSLARRRALPVLLSSCKHPSHRPLDTGNGDVASKKRFGGRGTGSGVGGPGNNRSLHWCLFCWERLGTCNGDNSYVARAKKSVGVLYVGLKDIFLRRCIGIASELQGHLGCTLHATRTQGCSQVPHMSNLLAMHMRLEASGMHRGCRSIVSDMSLDANASASGTQNIATKVKPSPQRGQAIATRSSLVVPSR